jgi:hypothetical protein
MIVPTIDDEDLDTGGLQTAHGLGSESMTKLVQSDVRRADRDERPTPESSDGRACGARKPERSEAIHGPIEPVPNTKADDVTNQRRDGRGQTTIDAVAADQRHQSIELAAHRGNANGRRFKRSVRPSAGLRLR